MSDISVGANEKVGKECTWLATETTTPRVSPSWWSLPDTERELYYLLYTVGNPAALEQYAFSTTLLGLMRPASKVVIGKLHNE